MDDTAPNPNSHSFLPVVGIAGVAVAVVAAVVAVAALGHGRAKLFGRTGSASHLHGLEGIDKKAINVETRIRQGTGTGAGRGGLRG